MGVWSFLVVLISQGARAGFRLAVKAAMDLRRSDCGGSSEKPIKIRKYEREKKERKKKILV